MGDVISANAPEETPGHLRSRAQHTTTTPATTSEKRVLRERKTPHSGTINMSTKASPQQPLRSPRPVRAKRPSEQSSSVTPKRQRSTVKSSHIAPKAPVSRPSAVEVNGPKDNQPKLLPVGNVQLLPVSRRSQRAGQSADVPAAIRIRKRARVKATPASPPQSSVERPAGLSCFPEWIDKDLESALVEMFHHRLKEEGVWVEMMEMAGNSAQGTARENGCGDDAQDDGVDASKHRKSMRLAHTPSNAGPGVAGKRIGFAPYTLRDSHCIRAMHCARGADEPIQISEGRLGQDARFVVEEMPEVLQEIAEEIRAEFPNELESPALDYAQVNVITMPVGHKAKHEQRADDEAIAVSPKTDIEEGRLEQANLRRRVILDYHKDHLVLGDIAVLCLQGSCMLRMRKGALEYAQLLRPRTLYLLRGPAREVWEHAIDDVHGERISIVFRSKRV